MTLLARAGASSKYAVGQGQHCNKEESEAPTDRTTPASTRWPATTWNPIAGSRIWGRGCDNCNAERPAREKLREMYLPRLRLDQTGPNPDPFVVRIYPKRLNQPWQVREPRMVFVNSMSDPFHIDIPVDFQRSMFNVMVQEDHHIYQVLTTRPGRAAKFVERNADLFADGVVPDHIWIGTSVEDMEVIHGVDQLRNVPANVRFLSCEPLLGPLEIDLDGIHWVIVGGESGVGHRPIEEAWVIDIRNQCLDQDVPFFFKQWGGRTAKAGGRLLEGLTWDEYPDAARALAGRCAGAASHASG